MIVPVREKRQLLVKHIPAKWHEDDARTFLLQAQDESFDDRDTAVLANSTETRLDVLPIAPGLELIAPELRTLIGEEVFGRRTCGIDSTFEEALNR